MSIPAADLEKLTGHDVEAAGLPDWRFMFTTIEAVFSTPSYAAGLALVAAIGAAAEEADHHPDLDLRYAALHVRLGSHDIGGVSRRDLRLAERISALAAEVGATARPERVQVVELGLDTWNRDAVRPFWAALLGLPEDPEQPMEIVDPAGRVHTLWFQHTEEHPTPRQRFHYDVRVAHDVVEQRIAAALAAGGTLVDDSAAPAFWVLADAQGNRACLTTWQGRE